MLAATDETARGQMTQISVVLGCGADTVNSDALQWSLDILSNHPNFICHPENEEFFFALSKVTINGVSRVKHQMNSTQNKIKRHVNGQVN